MNTSEAPEEKTPDQTKRILIAVPFLVMGIVLGGVTLCNVTTGGSCLGSEWERAVNLFFPGILIGVGIMALPQTRVMSILLIAGGCFILGMQLSEDGIPFVTKPVTDCP